MRKNTIISTIIAIIVIGFVFYYFSARVAVAPEDTISAQIENEFKNKVVYTTNMNFDKKVLINDCAKRGGRFNECGTVCETEAEICIEVCAYTCELDENKPLYADPSEFTTEMTKLETVSDYSGEGIATRDYDGSAYVFTATVKLDDLEDGKYFESWLINTDDPEDYFSAGRLEKAGGGYALTYASEENKLVYTEVLITLEDEESEEVGSMGEKVLYGIFGDTEN